MAKQEEIIIQSRFGEQIVDKSKIITFPRGLIGFEALHEFALLSSVESAMLILQSLEHASLGLLVAELYSFLPNHKVKIGDVEQKVLELEEASETTVLVTLSIPHGAPERTSLNLTGPIVINTNKKLGLQIPQSDVKPSHVLLSSLIENMELDTNPTSPEASTSAENTGASEAKQDSNLEISDRPQTKKRTKID